MGRSSLEWLCFFIAAVQRGSSLLQTRLIQLEGGRRIFSCRQPYSASRLFVCSFLLGVVKRYDARMIGISVHASIGVERLVEEQFFESGSVFRKDL
jgi:hypothetical protein